MIKGISDTKIEKIREADKKLDSRGTEFKTGLEMKDKRRQVIKLTTGANALDAILGGGIETASVTELFGGTKGILRLFSKVICAVLRVLICISSLIPYLLFIFIFYYIEFRTGKTQIAHTMCVSTQLSFEMSGGQGKVIYIDTEGNFYVFKYIQSLFSTAITAISILCITNNYIYN